ncbi:MAG: hypothetical protein K2J75_01555, partial [Clostridia bacterium]|nr:hypothetical protein [Clostridia bacterium]
FYLLPISLLAKREGILILSKLPTWSIFNYVNGIFKAPQPPLSVISTVAEKSLSVFFNQLILINNLR